MFFQVFKAFNRIMEQFGLEETFKGHLVHPLGHFPLDQVAQTPVQPGLEYFLHVFLVLGVLEPDPILSLLPRNFQCQK